MAQEIVIGGNRVGSGKKMKTSINDYERSTHNLSKKFASSLAPGVLYPCYKRLCTRGDHFEINIDGDIRTIPTKGPLFGTYKMQVDFYQVPIRLYVALLHNNAVKLGLNMSQVYLPQMEIKDQRDWSAKNALSGAFSNSCLMKYLGLSGIGVSAALSNNYIYRDLQCVPMLAYYDIFKCYYANKQEDNAYVISGNKHETNNNDLTKCSTASGRPITDAPEEQDSPTEIIDYDVTDYVKTIWQYEETAQGALTEDIIWKMPVNIELQSYPTSIVTTWEDLKENISDKDINSVIYSSPSEGVGCITVNKYTTEYLKYKNIRITHLQALDPEGYYEAEDKMQLKSFALSNIDDMRYKLLTYHTLGTPLKLKASDADAMLPYLCNYDQCDNGETRNKLPMNGLVIKTYQNDMFNNWLNSTWIEGAGSITELTKVRVDANGDFTMDALSFQKKRYELLNRIALSGGTAEDYQDVAYEESFRKHIETPMWVGGFSKEVVFDEVVQTAPADGDPLGTLGGRGRALNESMNGGKLDIKVDEWSYIIGIVSLTPRIYYTQGNDADLTEIQTIADIHVPAMDGIGFQDLMGERLLWADTHIQQNSGTIYRRTSVGKLPAWIEYMTDIDTAYGDFAETEGRGYMILNRNYEFNESTGFIKDATTYVDPSKYNYAFADTEITAQNFWCEIDMDIKARRLMSARVIPNV